MIAAPGKVQVTNLPLSVANTLYFFDVPQDTTHITLIARNKSTLKLSFNDATDYLTLYGGMGYCESNLKFNGAISLISSADNEVAEIICWYGQS